MNIPFAWHVSQHRGSSTLKIFHGRNLAKWAKSVGSLLQSSSQSAKSAKSEGFGASSATRRSLRKEHLPCWSTRCNMASQSNGKVTTAASAIEQIDSLLHPAIYQAKCIQMCLFVHVQLCQPLPALILWDWGFLCASIYQLMISQHSYCQHLRLQLAKAGFARQKLLMLRCSHTAGYDLARFRKIPA